MAYENVQFVVEGRLGILTIDRPRALNALNRATLEEIDAVLERCITRQEADVLILTGGGPKSFVAGADIAEMKDMDPEQAYAFARLGQQVFDKLQSPALVTLAAVNGFALGGGCELALACDLILASETARFGQPEVNLGVIPGFGGTQRLARRVGGAWAKLLVMSGDVISAEEAARIGLVARVYPAAELMNEVRKLAGTILSRGMVAVKLSKQAVDAGLEGTLAAGLELEARQFSRCFTTADQREGMEAFLGKRKPVFTGK